MGSAGSRKQKPARCLRERVMPHSLCAQCGHNSERGCHYVNYCGRDHQTKHWVEHKGPEDLRIPTVYSTSQRVEKVIFVRRILPRNSGRSIMMEQRDASRFSRLVVGCLQALTSSSRLRSTSSALAVPRLRQDLLLRGGREQREELAKSLNFAEAELGKVGREGF